MSPAPKAPPKRTDQPFHRALDAWMIYLDISARELSRRIDALDDKRGRLSFATIAALQRGDVLPGLRAMELTARALKIEPAHFAEWRLDDKRRRLDYRHIGLDKALAELGE